ncbi:hypothetical protein V1273_000186 [Bradyrhizobium sp. AZCC 1721]
MKMAKHYPPGRVDFASMTLSAASLFSTPKTPR